MTRGFFSCFPGFVLAAIWAVSAFGQTVVPESRFVYTRDADFPGNDLRNLFDTTQKACERACVADPSCGAFTFNVRNNACFPKSAAAEAVPFAGANSARKILTDPSVLARAQARAVILEGVGAPDFEAARDLVASNARQYPAGDQGAGDLAAALSSSLVRKQYANARVWAGFMASLTDGQDAWTAYSFAALRLPESTPSNQRRQARRAAIPAALNGVLRATNDIAEASALDQLAEALQKNGRGRDSIDVLRRAVSLSGRVDVEERLESAINTFGFRVTDHQVDNDSALPRMCATFSEGLAEKGIDYESYVKVPDEQVIVTAEDAQLCVGGLSHGARYAVTFRRGLPAASGEVTQKDVTLNIYVRDRAPSLRFPGRAYVLPRFPGAALPIETVNLAEVDLRLREVSDRNLLRAIRDGYFGRPLTKYEDDIFASDIGAEVWTGTATVASELNLETITRLPLGDMLQGRAPGIYALTARVPGADPWSDAGATQWFVLSDLGVGTMNASNGLHVSVRSLADTGSVEGASVSLVSKANAVLGTALTGADGFAVFAPGLSRGTGASAPALVLVETANDLAFLSLNDPAFDLSDRGVEGRAAPGPIDVFVATDRGAYRAGETIGVTALLRDTGATAVPGLPLTAVLYRPDGAEYSRTVSSDHNAGGHVFKLPIGADVPRGTWRLDLVLGPGGDALASQTLLVEDFLPERLDFTLETQGALRPGDTPPLRVEARYLFGAPAADLSVDAELQMRPTRSLEAWPGYLFGPHDSSVRPRISYTDAERTNADGVATLALEVPPNDAEGVPLEATIIARVSEGSGRPVERRITAPVATGMPLVGIKPGFDDVAEQGADTAFSLIALDRGGVPVTGPVRWALNRVETRYQWYQLYGNWNWEPTTRRTRVATGEVTLAGAPATISAPVEWGEYELVVELQDGSFMTASHLFYAGWFGGGDASDTPDRLSVGLDKRSYAVGDRAEVLVETQSAATALVTVLSSDVVHTEVVALKKGENRVPLSVTESWGSGVYVSVSALRPAGIDDPAPVRALGIAHATVSPGNRQLSVEILAADVTNGQAGTTPVTLKVAGASSKTFVTLSAVDLGILNLTAHQSPDPSGHYFGQRRLGVELRDLYGRLIDGQSGSLGQVRSGGDAGASMTVQSPPPTETPMVFFSGLLPVNEDGTVTVNVPKPAFNGTIRLDAVAWSNEGVGNASSGIVARDPVVMTASLPRFLAPGDESRMLLEFVAADGQGGALDLQIAAPGLPLGIVPGRVMVQPGGKNVIEIPVSGASPGDYTVTVTLALPDGEIITKELMLGVRQNDPEVSSTQRFSLAPGQTFRFDTEVFAGLQPGTGGATLAAGPLARFDMPGLIGQLDRYPYGCTEQVTSGALPLLYLSEFAPDSDVKQRIETAISRILTRQTSSGAFGLWRAEAGYFWLDAYVSDFLTRARDAGFGVPELALGLALDNLRNRVNYAPDFEKGGEDIAYALYVLAREGKASVADLRYYADAKRDAFATPLAAAQVGAALASYGDSLRADAMFRRANELLGQQSGDARRWRADYGSHVSDTAGVLRLAAASGSLAVDTGRLAQSLAPTRNLSTQEAAQVLLAVNSLRETAGSAGLSVNGVPAAGPVIQRLNNTGAGGVFNIENTGSSAMDVTLTTFGVPENPTGAGGYGYVLTREYFRQDGTRFQGAVRTGDQLIVVLTVTPFEETGARLMIDDPLPAGLEIDNPNLIRSGQVRELDWLKPANTQSAEFLSDRFRAALDVRGTDPVRVAYKVRAVSPGVYHHPAALVHDMYRPEYRAVTETGRLQVLR